MHQTLPPSPGGVRSLGFVVVELVGDCLPVADAAPSLSGLKHGPIHTLYGNRKKGLMMATAALERAGASNLGAQLNQRIRFWALPLIGTALYPELIALFSRAIDGYRGSGNMLYAGSATVLILLAGSIPIISARALILMREDDAVGRVLARSLLYLMFSAPPLYVFAGELEWLAGVNRHGVAIWISGWTLAAAALYFRKGNTLPKKTGIGITWLRVVHGSVALCLLCGFLLAHLVNHDLALWSVKLHGELMGWLRHWYRSEWVEPALFVLLAIMIATGAPLVASYSRQRADTFRILQMATGVYIGLFLCAHVFAVLAARRAGVETDWYFGVGAHGLLDGRGGLIAYYIYSAFFLILHAGCGLRIVLLKHGTREAVANQAVYGVAALGLAITTLLTVAAFGFHFRGP
jgi:succinate dehydrogenase/fumarate reductase cytochrome b subunit